MDALRKARKLRGVSVRELARRANYSSAYVSDVELGRRNCSAKLLKLYQAMHRKNMGLAAEGDKL
jgi:transcriptional regulator with XRE-family HTH domain